MGIMEITLPYQIL